MWALIDANSFFASVEKVFHPGLGGKPVVVLSSNDGIIVALTPEAKSIGLHRGDPIFKVKDIVQRNHVSVFSTNMPLYAAMSSRIASIIRQSVERVEQYSIDESFADLSGYDAVCSPGEYMRDVADRIRMWTDVPVSVGVAPTKTLAKIGSKYAKQYRGYRSVCVIDSEQKRRKALAGFDIADVWGIGHSTLERLHSLGVDNTLEFADKPGDWVYGHFHKPGVQTWLELNGYQCIDTSEMLQRQSITTSRSFAAMVSDIRHLKAAVATFVASCAVKLRAQGSSAAMITVYLCSNRFRDDLPQYCNAASYRFSVPTADTLEITAAAERIADDLFRPGILYKKAGVILSDIHPGCVQNVLFDSVEKRQERLVLSDTMDNLNVRFGCRKVRLAVEGGGEEPWMARSQYRSGNYLTDINDLLTIRI